MSSAQIIQQAEDLKASVGDTSSGSNEAWVSRQALQDLYQKLLVMDLEFALDKKVEQDLWNYAFKNQITVLQNQVKDKQNPKRNEIQSSLNLFLETAAGFYLQLLQELCSAFKLDLPFRRKSSNFGILKEYGSINSKIRLPKLSSSMYICQHCLVHLGDIARYRQQIDQAQSYYRHAAHLVPYNGQPYNQLAILEAAKSNKLSTVFYYARSIAVKHPFPVASTNLDKFYAKISKETLDYRGKLSMSETISTFLQFHAFIHLHSAPDKARKHGERLILSLPTHITSTSFSSYQLVQMVAINLFAIHRAQRRPTADEGSDNKDPVPEGDGNRAYTIVLNLTVSLLEQLVYHTPKQEQKAKDYHTLPAIKVLLDWLTAEGSMLALPELTNSTVWGNLSKLLNNLQFHGGQKDVNFDQEKYLRTPLPEDCDLQCFLPMIKAYTHLDFNKANSDIISGDVDVRLRCQRLVEHGRRIADEFSSFNLLNYTRLKSGRLQFSTQGAQVKMLTSGTEPDTPVERKHVRQNVAIQAIMMKKDMSAMKKDSPALPNEGPTPTHGHQEPQQHQQVRQQPQQTPPTFQPYKQPHPYSTQTYPQFQPLPYQHRQGINGDAGPQPVGAAVHAPSQEASSPGSHPQLATQYQQHQQQQQQQQQQHQQQQQPVLSGGHPGAFGRGPLPVGQVTPQGLPNSLRSMGHPQTVGNFGPDISKGGSPRGSLDISALQQGQAQLPQGQHHHQHQDQHGPQQATFQQAPGSGLSPSGQSGRAAGTQFGCQMPSQPANQPQTLIGQQSAGLHGAPGTIPPGRPPLHQFQHAQPFAHNCSPNQSQFGSVEPTAANQAAFPSASPTGMPHHAPQPYNQQFPQARAPSPVSQALGSNNQLLNLLNSGSLTPGFPLSQTLLSLASSGSGLPGGHQVMPESAGHGPYNRLGPEEQQGLGYQVGMGSFSLESAGNRGLILPQEDFNKDEPELKFSELQLDPVSSGLGLSGLTIGSQSGTARPDSPASVPSSITSLFSSSSSSGHPDNQADSTYSLFSKSPWTVQLSKPESNKSLSSSPFGSAEDTGSLRNTPDTFGERADGSSSSTSMAAGFPIRGFPFNSVDAGWTTPTSMMGPARELPTVTAATPAAPGGTASGGEGTKTTGSSLLSSSIQSLWSSGPSPLEKLLEQQKQQRLGDPH